MGSLHDRSARPCPSTTSGPSVHERCRLTFLLLGPRWRTPVLFCGVASFLRSSTLPPRDVPVRPSVAVRLSFSNRIFRSSCSFFFSLSAVHEQCPQVGSDIQGVEDQRQAQPGRCRRFAMAARRNPMHARLNARVCDAMRCDAEDSTVEMLVVVALGRQSVFVPCF